MGQHSTRTQDRVAIIGLVNRFLAPELASPRTRDKPPSGYGVREQCVPFTAAAALGATIPSPFSWGFCMPADVPKGARAFRCPVSGGCAHRVFYVIDNSQLFFARNQFTVSADIQKQIGPAPIPGLSFFDRADQQDQIKLHLPYVWKTCAGICVLFTPLVNRPRVDGLGVVSGLVECDWYTNPVNLVLQLPSAPQSVHIRAGEIIAQAVLIDSSLRRPDIEILEGHRRESRNVFKGVSEWRDQHERDRSAYKRLAKSRHGQLPEAEN